MNKRSMRKRYLLSAFIAAVAWSTTYTSTAPSLTKALSSVQIGAAAQANGRWKPNPERGSASSTLSGGRRGITASACALDADVPDPALTLLVPSGNYTELTTKAQPTLSWFVESDTITHMEFILSLPEQATPLYTKAISAEAGLVEVTLPAAIALQEGVRYRWTVFMTCNDGEREVHARSFVKRVAIDAMPAALNAMPSREQADIYAANGIWYDALNALVLAYREDTQMTTLLAIRELLEQVNTDVPLDLSLATAS